MGFLTEDVKATRVMNAVAAGQTAQNSTGVDMTGWDGVMFIVSFGAITASAVTSCHMAQGDTLSGSYADLTGTSISVADDDDNQIVILNLEKPIDRFVRCEISRGTADAVIDGVVALQYKGNRPSTHDATTVVGTETHVSPAEGTA